MTNETSPAPPEIVTRYLAAADAKDPDGIADCFTTDGTVTDEGETWVGRAEIKAWREALIGKFTYTTTVTGSEATGDGTYRVTTHIEGDFPGGVADLAFTFTIDNGLIAALHIG